ncbi:hypothetical protein AB0C27_44655 [Nonomuraea sp. NPDC048882]|uniref:hypothetical protein n=1 Tax=Nonomuraea sp. NPDC048882 TaxID=3154347 RepID=UPI0033EEDBA2
MIASNPDYRFPAIAKLLTVQCTVVAGNVDEGMRAAASVVDDLPDKRRTTMVVQAARMALRAVPMGQRDRPAVRDVRSLPAKEVRPSWDCTVFGSDWTRPDPAGLLALGVLPRGWHRRVILPSVSKISLTSGPPRNPGRFTPGV